MNPLQDFNIYTRKQWLKNWQGHKDRLKDIVQSSGARVDSSRPQHFSMAFRKTQSKEFRKQGSVHAEAERIVAKANQQLSERLMSVEKGVKRSDPGYIRRSHSTRAHQLQKELLVCEENQRLVQRLSQVQPALTPATKLSDDYQQSRFFQDLRRKPLLTVNTAQSKAGSFRMATRSMERVVHSSHILLPIPALSRLSMGEAQGNRVEPGADGS